MRALQTGMYSGTIEASSRYEGIVACITSYRQMHFDQDMHFHENAHLSFVLQGGCSEKKKERYTRRAGGLTFYHAGEPHQIVQMAADGRHINIELERSFFTRHGLAEEDVLQVMKRIPDFKFVMVKIGKELATNDAFSNETIYSLLIALLGQSKSEGRHQDLPAWAVRAREYLQDCWNETGMLTALAGAVGVHPVTVSKYFPKYFSCTIGEYMRKLKIERALALINSPSATLTEVAYQCGFADQSHFTRTFKEYTGLLPSHYRKHLYKK